MSATRKQAAHDGAAVGKAPQPRARANAPLQRMLRGAGNHAICGMVQAKLRVGSAHDPLEAEAERAAATLGGCCSGKPAGEACSDCNVQRKAAAGAAEGHVIAPPSVDRVLRGSGTPLDAATRATMESHFGADFRDVRVHSGADAASSADAIDAHAYTSGRDIVFSGGAYQPQSSDGKRLLAHELAHVLQQRGIGDRTIRRDEKKKPPPSAPVDDPCAVSAPALTNAELVALYARTRLYVKSHPKGEDDLWYDHGNLLRRLDKERELRMGKGHVWLGDASLTTMPDVLYQLRSGIGRAIEVLPADLNKEAGKPSGDSKSSVMTVAQFHRYLERHRIQSIDMREYFAKQDPNAPLNPLTYVLPEPERPKAAASEFLDPAALSTMFLDPRDRIGPPLPAFGMPGAAWGTAGVNAFGGYVHPFAQFASKAAAVDIYSGNPAGLTVRQQSGGEVNWRGDMPEIAAGRGTWQKWITYGDLNKVQPNFEVFDYRGRFGNNPLVSVTHTIPNRQGRTSFAGYDEKFLKAIGMEEAPKFAVSLGRLNQEFGTNMQVVDANERTYLAINDDHVATYRTRLSADMRANPGKYATLLDALLRKDPVAVTAADGTVSYLRNWNDLQNASAANTISAAVFDSTVTRLSTAAGERVIGSGMTTTEIQVLQRFRARHWAVTPELWSRSVAPELLDAVRSGSIDPVTGNVKPGYRKMMASSAKGGALMGGVFTGAVDAGRFIGNPEAHPDMWREGVVDIGLGALGSAGSATIESGVAAYTSNALAGQAGRGASMLRVLGRGGGGLLGGLAAPAVTMGALMLDSEEHSRLDYYGAMARSGASAGVGGFAGALATGTYFAIAGSEFPIVGNAIGFVVGFGGALAFDAWTGEDIEKGVHELGGAAGCVNKAVPV